jgi:cell division protein FtsA
MGRAVAALDFGTSKVSALIGRMETGGGIAVLGAGMTPYAGFRNHEWMEPNELSHVIRKTRRKTERKAHRRIRELYIVVPGEFTATELRQVSLRPTGAGGQITREDMAELYRMAADYDRPEDYRILHRDLLGASLDGKMYWEDPTGRQCGR